MAGYAPDTGKNGGKHLLRTPFTRKTSLETLKAALAAGYSLNSAAT